MSHAPIEAAQDPTKPQNTAYQAANNRQQELLRNGVSNSGYERNCCFLNTGTGRFTNISAAAGMGTENSIDRLIVQWPGGGAEEFTKVEADRHYTIRQGSGQARPWSRPQGDLQLAASENEPAEPAEQGRIQLRYRIPMPALRYEMLEGEERSLGAGGAAPTLVNLWASWCQPCLKELADFRRHEGQLRQAGLQVVALSIDQLNGLDQYSFQSRSGRRWLCIGR